IFDGLRHLTERPTKAESAAAASGTGATPSDARAAEGDDWAAQVDPEAFESESTSTAPPTLEENDAVDADEVPEAIREDLARAEAEKSGRRRSTMLTVIALILLAALAVQYAWFRPETILGAYPQTRPLLETFCVLTGCRVPDRRDPSKIQMLARDVRVHPGYEGALLVSATLVNAASHAQPYPRLQFSVFNVNGQTIASRVFEPEEYLSPDLDPKGNMSPGKPLQIAIELIAPEEAAISYEFRFL
ncbi:MAG: DUF3426 domain-containing protein, partial [Gammaproteobacteria bacterium]|nr:DUF3426 domain-containing protein [Gammaproteobacteria bacterium]